MFVRFFLWIFGAGVLAAVIGGIWFYTYIHAYDAIIREAGTRYGVDPKLIRSVIWRESRFNYLRLGQHHEVGLMQVTERAAGEWGSSCGRTVKAVDLLNPTNNIQAGTWYLARAMRYWSKKPDPIPYALAEYNAGRSNTIRWSVGDQNSPDTFCRNITYPTTRQYVKDITWWYRLPY